MQLEHKVAVVTGAGGGIGRGLAMALARRGCHLALADIDDAALQRSTAELRQLGVTVSSHRLDVADRGAVAALPAAVLAAHGSVQLLVNNAGIAAGGDFEQLSEAVFDLVMEVNFHAVVRLTRAFLPHLRGQAEARIVNISSLFGLIAPAGQTAYSASKFAVRGFSHALRHELEGSTVGVSVVHPGGVATAIARNARIPDGAPAAEVAQRLAAVERLLRMPAERAGELIARGIAAGRPRILVGADARLGALLERLLPVRYWSLLRRLLG